MTKKTRYFLAGSAAILLAGVCTGLVAYYAGGFQPVAASAVSNELRYIPANASLVAYADVRSIMDSELRLRLKQAMPGQEQGQKEFFDHTGIDIERDIDYVVAAMTPGTSEKGAPLVVARGRFNDTQLETLAREHGGQVEEYKGKRLLVATRKVEGVEIEHHDMPPGSVVLAFLEPGLIAIGELGAVKSAIDAQMSSQSVTSNNEMMELVGEIGRSNNAWAVGRFEAIAHQANLHQNLPPQAAAQLNLVKWFAAAGHINGGVSGTLRAEARDDQAAQELRKGIDGLMALARLAGGSDAKATAVLQSLQLSGTGKSVVLSFTVPAELLDMALPPASQPQPQYIVANRPNETSSPEGSLNGERAGETSPALSFSLPGLYASSRLG
jgi:hypothetical protein